MSAVSAASSTRPRGALRCVERRRPDTRRASLSDTSNLEHLTKPPDLIEADERASEDHEGFVDVGAPLLADGGTAEAAEPGQGSLDDPSASAQTLASVHPTSDAGRDGAGAAFGPAAPVIRGLVRVQLPGPPARPTSAAPHVRHGVQGGRRHEAVVAVGWAQARSERRAPAVDPKMAFRARFAAIRRVRSGFGAPFWPTRTRYPGWPGSSPDALHPKGAPEAQDEAAPGHRRAARHAGVASTSPSSPVRAAASPRRCPTGDARAQNEDDASQGGAIIAAGAAPFRLGRLRR